LGTYSKTLCPTLRVGFVVVPKQLLGSASNSDRLIEGISVAKSFITCNTSQFMQSLVGGVLLSEKGSLAGIIAPALNHYKHNLQAISGELQTTLGDYRDLLTWNRPAGGFFLTVNLPFPFGHEEATRCASEHKAIVLPLSFFALTNEHNNSVRLAFSNLSIAQIEVGIHGFAAFVKSRL
jgi:(S)-3,5-dihydroxyphenylglycine transaminase